jgi:hypothetical protein
VGREGGDMSEISKLPTQAAKDSEAIDRMVDGLIERRTQIRSGIVVFFDHQGIPHLSAANTTLADESYMVALMQERLMRLLAHD